MEAVLKKILETFVYSNLFIAIAAVAMVNYTFTIFQINPSITFLKFVFSATLCSYSFHWYLSANDTASGNRLIWTLNNRYLLVALIPITAISCIYLFFQLESSHLWVFLSGLATFIYTAPKIEARPFIWLRKIAVGKTLYLTIVWVYVTVFLPLNLMDISLDSKEMWFGINRFFLIFPICVLFDRKDRESDIRQGIHNVIYNLTSKQIGVLLGMCMVVFFISGFMLWRVSHSFISSLVLNLPGLIFILLTPVHIKKPDDLYYYFLLDGLMMLSGILIFIIK